MEYTTLGRTGITVSRFGLGTMVLGAWGNTDLGACSRIVNTALDRGVNLIDTADMYGDGENEGIVGAAICGRRDDVVLCTKFHHPVGDHDDLDRQGTVAVGSWRLSTTASEGSTSTTSISIRPTGPIRRWRSTRPSTR